MPWATLKHSGLVADLPPEEAPAGAWTRVENVGFDLGVSRRVQGAARYTDPQVPPLFDLNVIVGAVSWWIYCGASQVWVTDGATHHNITPAAGLSVTAPNEWTGCVLNGVPVLNNTHDAPITWDGNPVSPCTTIPGWPAAARCQAIRANKYHLFALNIEDGTELPSVLWWSAAAAAGNVPTEWTPLVTNDAGDASLADTPGGIVDGLSLRDYFVVYKQSSVFIFTYVAGQYVYTQRKLYLSDGIAARNCVTEHEGKHYVLTGSDVIVHDGQETQSLLHGKVQQYVLKSIDPNFSERCWLQVRRLTKQLYVGIPTNGAAMPNVMISVDLIAGDVGVREIPETAHMGRGIVRLDTLGETWDGDPNPWDDDPTYWNEQNFNPFDDTMLGCVPGAPALLAMDADDLFDGQPITALLERSGLVLHQAIERVLVTRVAMRLEGEPGEVLTVRVGGQEVFNTPITWSDPIDVELGGPVVFGCEAEGRLIAIHIVGTTRRRWHLHSYKLEFEPLGIF